MSEAQRLLNELIDQAEREGKWLFCTYQGLEFTPKELRQANLEGRFRWGPENWKLVDPQARLIEAEEEKITADKKIESIRRRMQP